MAQGLTISAMNERLRAFRMPPPGAAMPAGVPGLPVADRGGPVHEGVPITRSQDGTFTVGHGMTVTDPRINNGQPTNIPTVIRGRELSEGDAIQAVVDAGGKNPMTGAVLPSFPSIEEAVSASKRNSKSLEAMPPLAPTALTVEQMNQRLKAPEPEQGLGASVLNALPQGMIDTAATVLNLPALKRRKDLATAKEFTERVRGAASLSDEDYKTLLRDIHTSSMSTDMRIPLGKAARKVREGKLDPQDLPDFGAHVGGNIFERAQESMRGFATETFPIPKEHEQRLPVQIARGVGSTGVFVGSRLLPGGQLLLPGVAGFAGSGEAIERAAQEGASDEEQSRAALAGIIPGLTDIAPIERLLKPVAHVPGFKGVLYGVARKAVEQGLIEGTQEAVQEFMQNAIAKFERMPEQELSQGIAENGLVGFIVGALFGGAAGVAQSRQGGVPAPEGPPPPSAPADESPVAPETASMRVPTSEGVQPAPTTISEPPPIVGEQVPEAVRASKPLSVAEMNQRVRGMAGSRYEGMRQDAPGTGARDIDNPIRREDILRPLAAALGAPLYQGRIKSKKTLGFFRPKVEEVRLKRANDIEVAAHEIAHLIDHRIPEVRRQWNPATKANATIREELRSVSYDQRKLYEGFAEFVRLWATQPDKARAAAPTFNGWFEDFVARSEYGPALREAKKGMLAWFEQDALKRARSKIGQAEDINAGLTSPFSRFRQAVVDDLHGIERMERTLTGGVAPVGAYETARLTRAKYPLIEGALTLGAPVVKPDGSHAFEGKGLQQILEPVAGDLDKFWTYAVGRSARELLSQGRERLFTKNEVDAMVALETPEYRQAFSDYQQWNQAILDFAQRKGVISPMFRSQWRRAQYLPFHRIGQGGSSAKSGGAPGDWSGIKSLTGGTENLREIGQNVIQNAAMLMDVALTNEARQEVAKLARMQGGAKFMARIPKEERKVLVGRDQVERAIVEALGAASRRELPPMLQKLIREISGGLGPLTEFLIRGQAPQGPNVVAVLHNGERSYYEVADPVLFRSLVSLNRPARSWLVKALNVPKRVGQASITLAFDFMAANLARDTLMGGVMSRHGFKPFVDSLRGMKSRIATDRNYRDFIANGGGFSSYLIDDAAFKRHLETWYGSKGINPRYVLDTPAKLLFGLERIADSFEMSTRLGEFRRAVERGAPKRHAAYLAREVSTDFAMRGGGLPQGHPAHDLWDAAAEATGFAYDSIIFLKAAVNGVDRYYRGLTRDPNRGAIAAKTGLIALASMALYALNKDNPLYDELEDWDRDTHWHFFIPTEAYYRFVAETGRPPRTSEESGGLYLHFRYPKIWEIGAIASGAERTLEGFLRQQPVESAQNVLRVLLEQFRVEYIPQAFAPLYEVATNRIRFLDRPIETQAMKEVAPWARSGPYTSTTLRKAGEAVRNVPGLNRISPAQAESLLRGYFNTWAMYGLSLSDAVAFDDRPDLRLDQYPVVRRFFRQTPARNTRYVAELYDMLDAATEARRTMRLMDRTNRPEIAGELEQTPENLRHGQMTRADKQMRAIAAEIRQVYNAGSLDELREIATSRSRLTGQRDLVAALKRKGAWNDTGKLKRGLMDDLIAERSQFARTVVEDLNAERR